MRDDVDLFTAGLLYDLQNLFADVFGIIHDGSKRLLIAIVDRGSVPGQFPGNTSPVVEKVQIAETNACLLYTSRCV